MRFADLLEKRDDILSIAARHGASNVRVFGSVARDEAGQESDVDFLMDTLPNGLIEYMGLIQDLEDLLGRRVDVGSEAQLHRVVRDRAVREAIPL
ncbi:MAG: nucleotidyltransferase family protein [Thermomicrobiales bacterium]